MTYMIYMTCHKSFVIWRHFMTYNFVIWLLIQAGIINLASIIVLNFWLKENKWQYLVLLFHNSGQNYESHVLLIWLNDKWLICHMSYDSKVIFEAIWPCHVPTLDVTAKVELKEKKYFIGNFYLKKFRHISNCRSMMPIILFYPTKFLLFSLVKK
jgi:hypothetical protein